MFTAYIERRKVCSAGTEGLAGPHQHSQISSARCGRLDAVFLRCSAHIEAVGRLSGGFVDGGLPIIYSAMLPPCDA